MSRIVVRDLDVVPIDARGVAQGLSGNRRRKRACLTEVLTLGRGNLKKTTTTLPRRKKDLTTWPIATPSNKTKIDANHSRA